MTAIPENTPAIKSAAELLNTAGLPDELLKKPSTGRFDYIGDRIVDLVQALNKAGHAPDRLELRTAYFNQHGELLKDSTASGQLAKLTDATDGRVVQTEVSQGRRSATYCLPEFAAQFPAPKKAEKAEPAAEAAAPATDPQKPAKK